MIRFISTRHGVYGLPGYFEKGTTVIDPFRYVPDTAGVRVRRIGQNKPELISLLLPSRSRPKQHARMLDSAFEFATHDRQLEVITYLDRDDPDVGMYWRHPQGQVIVGDRILLSECWNECLKRARGEILMHCGDDIIFRTPGWDAIVREAFRSVPDRIVCIHGDDVSPNTDALATHGFYHRRWVEALGYFVPPLFSSDWNDVWLTDVADMIGRRVKVPIVTEHMHYSLDKALYDDTYREREERGREDGVVELFKKTKREREIDAAKLREVMA